MPRNINIHSLGGGNESMSPLKTKLTGIWRAEYRISGIGQGHEWRKKDNGESESESESEREREREKDRERERMKTEIPSIISQSACI
jgi:hypothetical protein